MKTSVRLFGIFSIVVAVLASGAISRADSFGAIRVGFVEGDVQVMIADTGDWAPASANMPLLEGDELWIPEGSRAAVQTDTGAHIRLDAGTALQILRTDRDAFQFHLSQGRAYVLNNPARRGVLQFDTPDASIRTFDVSAFDIDVPERETDVSVFRGSVRAESGAGTTTVRAGDMLALWGDEAELYPLPQPDAWIAWNNRRDRSILARGRSYRYLPDELRVYSGDFDDNGRWMRVPEYGYCWIPTVTVTVDWAPYRNGRWIWRGGDYVWIGYEPWGWAPYHYGRWAHDPRFGWFWVPPSRGDAYWGPGYVGWVREGEHVAWVPLAPRETYYGHGNYGRYSVNVTNVNINRINVTNVYRNVNVVNSVTVVNRTTFVTGRPSPVNRDVVNIVREDFARRRNVIVGRVPIEPERTSRLPVVRSIPEAKQPPSSVRRIDVKELKRARTLAREADRSAIQGRARPRELEVKKIDKPGAASERIRERQRMRHEDRRVPVSPPAEKPARELERGTAPHGAPPEKTVPKAVPPERKIQREAPPERVRPQQVPPAERRKLREAPPAPEKPEPQAKPPEDRIQREAPPERVRPQQVPPAERRKLREAPPPPEKPEVQKESPDNVMREVPRERMEREGERGHR